MAVLSSKRLASSRADFATFVSGKKEATQARYWREYNRFNPPQELPRIRPSGRYAPSKVPYERSSDTASFTRKDGGNRYAIVVKAEFTRGRKKEIRHYSIVKGNTGLDNDDLDRIEQDLRIEYNVRGKVNFSITQTVDRFTPLDKRVRFD